MTPQLPNPPRFASGNNQPQSSEDWNALSRWFDAIKKWVFSLGIPGQLLTLNAPPYPSAPTDHGRPPFQPYRPGSPFLPSSMIPAGAPAQPYPSAKFKAYQVVTANTPGNVYQNTDPTVRTVNFSATMAATFSDMLAFTDSANPPVTLVCAVSGEAAQGGHNPIRQIVFDVLPGNYYQITYNGAITFGTWVETNAGTPGF